MSEMSAEQKAKVLDFLQEGRSSQEIADAVGLTRQQVAAIKAHVTMGTYRSETDEEQEVVEATQTGLRYERMLQVELRAKIGLIEHGLHIADGGSERKVASGSIDILAKDGAGNFVVLELKVGTGDRRDVGQLLSYMGDLDVDSPTVRGILVAKDFKQSAISAARAARRVRLVEYSISFAFSEPRH